MFPNRHIQIFKFLHHLLFQKLVTAHRRDIPCITTNETNSEQEFYVDNLNESLVDDYEGYCKGTRSGKYGATAKFWITYINFVKFYLELSRSIRQMIYNYLNFVC